MKIRNALCVTGILLASLHGYSQETCHEGFVCDQSSAMHIVLQEVKLVQDETLLTCETYTLRDFGMDSLACQNEATKLSRKQPAAPIVNPPAACRPEAQIIAVVTETQKVGMDSCVAKLDPRSIRQFNPSGVCPLDISEALEGVEVGVKNGHDCALDIGQILSGVLYKDSAGRIRLE